MGNVKNSKKQPKVKEPIQLRFKELANGNKSAYLDMYNAGKRQYEFLKLYLIPERTSLDKERNRQTLEIIAESKNPQTKRSYDTLILFIQRFAPKTTFKQVDKKFCLGFINYLKDTDGIKTDKLSANTQAAYFNKLKVAFKRAVEDEIITIA